MPREHNHEAFKQKFQQILSEELGHTKMNTKKESLYTFFYEQSLVESQVYASFCRSASVGPFQVQSTQYP